MAIRSESGPGRIFAFRWRRRIFWCHGCGIRMRSRNGVLTKTEDGKIQWGCMTCYLAAERRAAT